MAIIKKFRIKSFKNNKEIVKLENISFSFHWRSIISHPVITFPLNLKHADKCVLVSGHATRHIGTAAPPEQTLIYLNDREKGICPVFNQRQFVILCFTDSLGSLCGNLINWRKSPSQQHVWSIISFFLLLYVFAQL